MNKLKQYFALKTILSIVFVIALASSAFGQKPDDTKNAEATKTTTVNAANPSTVDARQSGTWTVGIEPTKNTVQLSNTTTNPLPVKVVENTSKQKAFQARAIVNVSNTGFQSALLPIPAGKRLVIENVSAIARLPEGLRMEMNFFTYIDNNNDGVADIADIVFHRIALTEQGVFDGTAIYSANHKVLIFADEQIGTQHLQVVMQARLNGAATTPAQAQVTFTGYLEDLPAAQ